MSSYNRLKGKLIPVKLSSNQTLWDKVKELCYEVKPEIEVDEEMDDPYYKDNPLDYLWECSYISGDAFEYCYLTQTNTLYKVEAKEYKEIDFIDLQNNPDGSIDVHMLYYNCAGYEEYIDEYLKPKKK